MRPTAAIELALTGHAEWLETVDKLPDADFGRPSLLPDWSRARVVAHLAHKSQSHVAPFVGATAGQVRPQWPDGRAAAEIETLEWSQRPPREVREVLAASFQALEAAWVALPPDRWAHFGVSSAGQRSMTEFVDRHLRDTYVHLVDLGVGYLPEHWPDAFVGPELSKRLRDLPDRAAGFDLLAWLLGRASAPTLSPW